MARGTALMVSALALAIALMSESVGPVVAEGPLQPLDTGEDGKGWEAVGRINIGRSGYCTGTLIADDLVLTAAHCLYDPAGRPVEIGVLEFAAGFRNGGAQAFRRVRRAAIHPDYAYEGRDRVSRVAFDLALLELDQPIRNPAIRPFATTGRSYIGGAVAIVSYASGRDEVPTLEELCRVLGRQARVIMVSCEVDFGASGAPIFVVDDGVPLIVSVVSAKAESDGAPVALAAELGATLDAVRAQLASTDGVFARSTPSLSAVPAPEPRSGPGGAKFVRP